MFNVERRGIENKYSGMLAWEEGILYLCEGFLQKCLLTSACKVEDAHFVQ